MTTENPSGEDAAQEADAAATRTAGTTGEGGPQQRRATADLPPPATRAPRVAHLDADESRPAVTDEAAPERAIVRRAQRRRAKRMQMTRRQLLNVSFWGVFGLGLTGALAGFLSNFWPRDVQGFGGKIAVSQDLVPDAGEAPARITVGNFWLSHLSDGEGVHEGFGEPGAGGLVALWWKCPHLGCTVPWRGDFTFEGVTGWFRCPCHGSTYTKAGVRVFGPAPRPMDTMDLTINADGSLTVDTGVVKKGSVDNPTRTVSYPYND